MRLLKWLLILLGAGVVLVVGGTFVYINFIRDDPPPPLSFEQRDEDLAASTTTAAPTDTPDTTAAPATDAEGVDGTWTVTAGSEAGYRATEILFGQDAVAAGRTTDVTGSIEISGTTVSTGSFSVDLTTVESAESRRDSQFQGRIMDTATYPTADFVLTEPLDFASLPADGESITVTANGELTLRGVTNAVSFELDARLNGGNIEVVGSIPVHYDDYEIPEPSGGPAQVSDDGEVEFLLVFTRA